MPVPKYKRTAYRSKQQTAAWREKIMKRLTNYLQFTPCTNCGTTKLSHTVCEACAGGSAKSMAAAKTAAKPAKASKKVAKKGEAKPAELEGGAAATPEAESK